MFRKPTETRAGKSSLFKRMNCFKPQNSEENPLILNKGQISGGKSSNSLKTNDVIQQQQQLEPLAIMNQQQMMQQHLQQMPQDFQDQSQLRVQDYQDELDQQNYEFYLNQLQNAQNFGQYMRENDARRLQQGQPPNRLPSIAPGGYYPHPSTSINLEQPPDVYYRPSITVCLFLFYYRFYDDFFSFIFIYL